MRVPILPVASVVPGVPVPMTTALLAQDIAPKGPPENVPFFRIVVLPVEPLTVRLVVDVPPVLPLPLPEDELLTFSVKFPVEPDALGPPFMTG